MTSNYIMTAMTKKKEKTVTAKGLNHPLTALALLLGLGLTLLSLTGLTGAAWADTLELHDGSVLTGTFLGGDADSIRFDNGTDVLVFARREIRKLSLDKAASTVAGVDDPDAVTGEVLPRLPDPVSTVRVDGALYYYHAGYFYRRYGGGYVAISGPVGARVPLLPVGRVVLTFGGLNYFYFAGVYYQWRPYLGMYVVINPPFGIYVNDLPWGSVSIVFGGIHYWRHGHHWYRRYRHGGGWHYRVVHTPPGYHRDRDRGYRSAMPILPGKGNSAYNQPGRNVGRNGGRDRAVVKPSSPNSGRTSGNNRGSTTGSSNYNNARINGQPYRTGPVGGNSGYTNSGKAQIRQPVTSAPGFSRSGGGQVNRPAQGSSGFNRGVSGGGKSFGGSPAAKPGRATEGNSNFKRGG